MQVPFTITKRGSFSPHESALCIPHCDQNARLRMDPAIRAHCELEFDDCECAITSERLALEKARAAKRRASCVLTTSEREILCREQKAIRKAILPNDGDSVATLASASAGTAGRAASGEDRRLSSSNTVVEEIDFEEDGMRMLSSLTAIPQDPSERPGRKRSIGTVKARLLTAKLRSRFDMDNDGVLGVQAPLTGRRNSQMTDKFTMYNLQNLGIPHSGPELHESIKGMGIDLDILGLEDVSDGEEEEEKETKDMDIENVSYVRKPDMTRIIEQAEAMQNHPKYSLSQVVLSRRFHLYAHRFANAQYQRTLVYPTLKQPLDFFNTDWLRSKRTCGTCEEGEKRRTRPGGHRFVIAADTQFGILMDGFAMDRPNWSQEIDISRECVAQINAMRGKERPLFVCVCGDLVDTESSFSGAIASWKKVMSGWERNLIFEQQVNDFKRVWAALHQDIALVCLCGNHDVGNRPTRASINRWTNSFGDEYLSFWANGTFNICLNNCLFSNPTGAQDMFEEQFEWVERQLVYARENDATHIFVYGHFPWFLRHEEEADDFLTSYSAPPAGWGPPGSSFADSYFTIPYEHRKVAMALFKKYDVTACFSGHFHQNVVAQTSWGMPMIVTGPLSMNLRSGIASELSNGEIDGIGMRVVDVGERGEFTHKWMLLDNKDKVCGRSLERTQRQRMGTDVGGQSPGE